MSDRRDEGLFAVLRRVVRTHRIESALVVAAAILCTVGMSLPTGGLGWRFASSANAPAPDVDGHIVSALLEVRDGEWRVRPDDVQLVPTLGHDWVVIRHTASGGVLSPSPDRATWMVGAPLPRHREPDWEIELSFRLLRGFGGEPMFDGDGYARDTRLFRSVDRVRARIGEVAIGAFISDGGPLLHLVTWIPGDDFDPRSVDTWRGLVTHQVRRLVEDTSPAADGDPQRQGDARTLLTRGTEQFALPALLQIPAVCEDLRVLDARLAGVRELAEEGDGRRTSPQRRVAVALLDEDPQTVPSTSDLSVLASRWPRPGSTPLLLDAVYPGIPALQEAATAAAALSAVPAPKRDLRPWALLALVALIGVLAFGSGERLRRRDAAAFAIALLTASACDPIVPLVTVECVGPMVIALVLERLRRRGALDAPRAVPRAFATGALLLLLGAVLRLPALDAAGRTLAFAGLAWMALGTLRATTTDPSPRRPAGGFMRAIATVLVLLATVAGVATAVLPLYVDANWIDAVATSRPAALVVFAAIALAAIAGVLAFARRRARNALPAAAVAVAIGAAIHLAFLYLAPFDDRSLPGAMKLARAGAVTAVVVATVAVVRLGARAWADRRERGSRPLHSAAGTTTIAA